MNIRQFIVASVASLLLSSVSAMAGVTLPSVISDGMVLEQNSTVKLWGWAKPYERVTIKTSWDGKEYTVDPAPDARWSVEIETPAGSKTPHSIEFTGYNCVKVSDVLMGEVILCSGQSNMEFQPTWSMWDNYAPKDSLLAQATQDDIRMFRVDYRTAAVPSHDVSGKWVHTTPDNARNFTVIGYVLACKLNRELGVPVGIVDSSWGGTPIESWTDNAIYEADAHLADANKRLSEVTWGPVRPGLIYNAMIAPLANFRFRAIAWYQGEQNCENADTYCEMLQALVKNWRSTFYKGEDIPFVFAQIAPYHYDDPGMAVVVRDQQRLAAQKIDNSALVVIGNLGDVKDIHPRFKVEAGDRFANALLTVAYGKSGFSYAAPLFKSASLDSKGKAVIVKFDNAEGLHCVGKSKTADWFELAGEDGVYHLATGKILKDGSVSVSSREVAKPHAVRFAWADDAWPNLENAAGLQASCFGEVCVR